MKLNFHMGVNLRCYGNVEIEAESIDAALPLLTADYLAEHFDVKEVTRDSGQELAIIDVSDAETGEDIVEWNDALFLPSPYDPQPDAELLAAVKGLEASMTAILASDNRRAGPAALIPGWLNDIRTALAKANINPEPPKQRMQHPFDPFAAAMEAEGWCVIEASGDGKWSIQADDESDALPDNEAALAHVERRAAEGSEPHKAALAFIKTANDEIEKEDRANG